MAAYWWFWVIWIVLIVSLFILPFAWGSRRWGAPRPYYWRREDLRRAELAEERSGWGWFADVIWIVLLVMLAWLVIALIF